MFKLILIFTALFSYDVVVDGGADPRGNFDSTDAFDKAAQSTLTTYGALDTADGRSGYSKPVYIPAGKYKISREIGGWGPMVVINSDRAVINQTVPNLRTFVFDTATKVSVTGLQFTGGLNSIYVSTANINGAEYNIDRCDFKSVVDYAIKTEKHMSAIMTVNRTEFNMCGGALHNSCDFAIVRDCWVNGFRNNSCFHSVRGRLHMHDVLMVPMGELIVGKYWISTYSHVKCYNCVFSGENGGNPIMKINGIGDINTYPYIGTKVLFKGCQLSAGPANFAGSMIVCLEDKAMFQRLKFEDCDYMVEVPIVYANGGSLATTLSGILKKEQVKLEFESCDIWPAINLTIANKRLPSELFTYTKVR